MFRASDIFGRRAGATPSKPSAPPKANAAEKRGAAGPSGYATRAWDPATGKFTEEELPADILEMMGVQKKAKTHEVKVEVDVNDPWRKSAQGAHAHASCAAGLGEAGGAAEQSAASVEFCGFSKVELNERYFEREGVVIHGRPTYWSRDSHFFVYWQGAVQRWAICDGTSFSAVKAGQYPGWAFKSDHKHCSQANGWQEAWAGTWREPALELKFRSSSQNKPQWDDPLNQQGVSAIEFRGFSMKELNTRYHEKPGESIAGRSTYWDSTGVYFLYWQQPMARWAICDLKCYEAVKAGQCPGWAYRADQHFFANACNWMESRGGEWSLGILQTTVHSICTKGLKVLLAGFGKTELNTTYAEKPEEQIQGKETYWDPSGEYFLYWQSSMQRWAVCDKASLSAAQSGLSPGWAYRTDSSHFAKTSGWMEAWGRDWQEAQVMCTVLEGSIKEFLLHDLKKAKEELKDEDEAAGSNPPVPLPTPAEATSSTEKIADEEVPKLSAKEYAILIQSIYEKCNAKKLADIGKLLMKFRQREEELYTEVCAKYELQPGAYYTTFLKEHPGQLVATS